MSKLGERLNKLRQERGLTQQELADFFHISNSAISSYETGNRVPDVDFLLELAKFYNTSSDYIIGLSDSRLPLDVLSSAVVDQISYQSVIEKMQKLSAERKQILLAILNDLYICSVAQENDSILGKKESEKQ